MSSGPDVAIGISGDRDFFWRSLRETSNGIDGGFDVIYENLGSLVLLFLLGH